MDVTAAPLPGMPGRTRRRTLLITVGAALLAGMGIWMIAAPDPVAERGRKTLSPEAFAEATGVRIIRAAITAGGGMIDLRYQVVNPDKSLIVHDRERPPTVIDETTGSSVSWSWMEHSHDRELHTAITYHELLMNPRGVFKRGRRITIDIGGSRLEGLVVQ